MAAWVAAEITSVRSNSTVWNCWSDVWKTYACDWKVFRRVRSNGCANGCAEWRERKAHRRLCRRRTRCPSVHWGRWTDRNSGGSNVLTTLYIELMSRIFVSFAIVVSQAISNGTCIYNPINTLKWSWKNERPSWTQKIVLRPVEVYFSVSSLHSLGVFIA